MGRQEHLVMLKIGIGASQHQAKRVFLAVGLVNRLGNSMESTLVKKASAAAAANE